ncbi:pentapeptide repeat-containing protein [Pseudomonas sp. F01002]|uniref:pentapeptide repeat-containing protein n=1 Tax=Pseudomonas sp. F01002 TaxID=2555724 RepID=UPI00106A2645|nr:hypothetical protein E3W21_22160 [Pseudomonas sp. F01002]
MHTRILRIVSRHAPEAGAVCGSSARTDLCGGWQVTAIPTATSYADLRGVDLRGAYLRGACFLGAKVDGADLRNANINECIFTGATGAFVSGEILYHNWDVGPKGVIPWLPDDEI